MDVSLVYAFVTISIVLATFTMSFSMPYLLTLRNTLDNKTQEIRNLFGCLNPAQLEKLHGKLSDSEEFKNKLEEFDKCLIGKLPTEIFSEVKKKIERLVREYLPTRGMPLFLCCFTSFFLGLGVIFYHYFRQFTCFNFIYILIVGMLIVQGLLLFRCTRMGAKFKPVVGIAILSEMKIAIEEIKQKKKRGN